MRLFATTEASHFSAQFTPRPGDAELGISDFYVGHLQSRHDLNENSPAFNDYRACLLRETERNLFLCASQYRRCLDMMLSSSSHWAFVTLYYGSWYAAQAILGMFGCRVFKQGYVIDVGIGTPGNQRLLKRKIGSGLNQEPVTATGSHRIFWEIYYNSVVPLRAIVPPHLTLAVTPVSGDELWQIKKRNDVNYETYSAISLIEDFETHFASATFPASLPGILNTQYAVVEAMIELAFTYAKQFGLNTDCLAFLGIQTLTGHIKERIYKPSAPHLVRRTRKRNVF